MIGTRAIMVPAATTRGSDTKVPCRRLMPSVSADQRHGSLDLRYAYAPEPLPDIGSIDLCGFDHLARYGLERIHEQKNVHGADQSRQGNADQVVLQLKVADNQELRDEDRLTGNQHR